MSVIIRYAEPGDAPAISALLKQEIASGEGYLVVCNGENESKMLGAIGAQVEGFIGVARAVSHDEQMLYELVLLYMTAVEFHTNIEKLYVVAEEVGSKDFLRERCGFAVVSRADAPAVVGSGTVMRRVFEREKGRIAA